MRLAVNEIESAKRRVERRGAGKKATPRLHAGRSQQLKLTGGTGKFNGLKADLAITVGPPKSNYDGIGQAAALSMRWRSSLRLHLCPYSVKT